MNCRETLALMPRFYDGELDARQMRCVAMHSTRCKTCEDELRKIERLQELVRDSINVRLEEMEFGEFWTGVESRLDAVPLPWWKRFEAWWGESGLPRSVPVPALAAVVLVALLGLLLLARAPQIVAPSEEPMVASVDGGALIDSLETEFDAVAVINDPETATTVLWVGDEDAFASGEGR